MHEGDAPSVEHQPGFQKMTGNDLFVPIIGERADGHDYICMAIEMVQRQCSPAVIKQKRKYRKLSLPSAKGTKKKKQRQKQRHGSVCLIQERRFRIWDILQKHASSSFWSVLPEAWKDYHP